MDPRHTNRPAADRRATHRRHHVRPPGGPATLPPSPPRSGKHRKRMLKGALRSLARLARVSVAELLAAAPAELLALADAAARPGVARRLATKVMRLSDAPAR